MCTPQGLADRVLAFQLAILIGGRVLSEKGDHEHEPACLCNNLDDQVLPFSQHLHDEYALVTPIFQDDNSTLHPAGRICYWFDEHSHTLLYLDWPAESPDLNPIENLWDMLEERVKRRNKHPRNLVDLRDQILREWHWMRRTCRSLWTRFLTESRRLSSPEAELHSIK
ncbi:hypothetical protein AVEN_50036-1 [Araneus ventricosus]|uniref:Tc1-like transposase DDE domain-containing protein n=1 Tax=Araneus ventricosus TaxID=182803 RepID=A0A4Y2N4S2_ARAVE|nr:hypothetical protein AVEN_50036-1 [Araneus ventricosus]